MEVTVSIGERVRQEAWRRDGVRIPSQHTVEIPDTEIIPDARAVIGMAQSMQMDWNEHIDANPADPDFAARVLAWVNAAPTRREREWEQRVEKWEERPDLFYGPYDRRVAKEIVAAAPIPQGSADLQERVRALITMLDERETREKDQKAREAKIREEANRKSQIAKEEADTRDAATRDEWIRAHGSERLKMILDENLIEDSLAVYRDERLALELPGWEWDEDGENREIRNPSFEALRALTEARKEVGETVSDLKLGYVWYDPDEEDYDGSGHGVVALQAEFLGRSVRSRIVTSEEA